MQKNDFEKPFFKLMINVAFGKAIGNVRKNRDIKLVITESWRNYLVSEPIYHTTIFFKDILAIEIKRTQILMNKSICFRSFNIETK